MQEPVVEQQPVAEAQAPVQEPVVEQQPVAEAQVPVQEPAGEQQPVAEAQASIVEPVVDQATGEVLTEEVLPPKPLAEAQVVHELPADIDEDLVQRVRKQLPKQPWPQGTQSKVARDLGLTTSQVIHAVDELIRRRIFFPQIDGIVFDLGWDESADSTV